MQTTQYVPYWKEGELDFCRKMDKKDNKKAKKKEPRQQMTGKRRLA